MDCCNYMEYRGHHLHGHNSNYPPHGYQLPYNQQPACFQSDGASNYHTGGLITFQDQYVFFTILLVLSYHKIPCAR